MTHPGACPHVAPLAALMISPQFRPIVGGYERAAERLSGALAREGLKVVVLTERRQADWPAEEELLGFQIRRLKCVHRRHLHVVTSLLSFGTFLVRHGRRFDVWHVHQYGLHGGLAIALGMVIRRPVVLKLTSSGTMDINSALGASLVGKALGFLHRRVDVCIALSEETRLDAVRFGIRPERILLVPNGVDGELFKPSTPEQRNAARRRLGLTCRRLVLFVGRLAPEKNPLGLLDAWRAIDERVRSGAMLAIVGDGPIADQVRERAKVPDIGQTVRVVGHREDVHNWYSAADVCVISSHREGLSNTMIEALASGVPVASTAVSGASVLEGETPAGIVTPPADMCALGRALQTLLTDDEKRLQCGASARRVFDSNFALESASGRIISLYRRLHKPTGDACA